MPARWKYTLIFEGRGHGWSETFYVENDTDDFPTVYAALANIAPKRAPLLGAECRIKGDRLAEVISTTGVVQKRVSQVRRLNLAGTQAHSADQTNTSLLATWITGDQKSKRLAFMGGVWDDVLPAPDVFSPSGAWTTFWNQWVAACQTAKLGWLTSGRTTPATITGYTFDATTGLTTYVLKAPGLVWPNGDDRPNKVAVEFPLARSPLDGVQIVVPADATHATTAKPRPAQPFTISGIMVLFAPTFKTIGVGSGQQLPGTITAQIGVSRKRGLPLLSSRGRLPVKVRW
jgi:hypothetical protein